MKLQRTNTVSSSQVNTSTNLTCFCAFLKYEHVDIKFSADTLEYLILFYVFD